MSNHSSQSTATPKPDAAAADVRSPEADLDAVGFEDAFAMLESSVQQLESGDLPLDGALAAYERGLALAKRCALLLEQVELKVRFVDGTGGDGGALEL